MNNASSMPKLIKNRKLLVPIVIVAALVVAWIILAMNCPSGGLALTQKQAALHQLKNRKAIPNEQDFDSSVTLDALLQPGDDRDRWSSNGRGAKIQGLVIDVEHAGAEATNCFNPCGRDIHILLARQAGAGKNQHVVVEVTPHFQNVDWSEKNLQATLVGHWVEFEGWLYFDVGHADQAENTAPGNPTNWRATAWEIHPVTRIVVVK